ncbi:hypothetical protein E1193_07290 [Micromonospora sp. KC606]|uniref:hypothetical protein n=1 Tax=Micromonospora sp. KC606 TaxID=2530379 RepID=UPI0010518CB5|nr:hypothetical protein [Micromonospora sp. KC606]TDC84009.1 hypothetical protein E1193_07290 [Micromonospora sp. KC606]
MRKGLLRSISLTLGFVLVSTFAVTTPAHATLAWSGFSGTVAPGASQTRHWNNALSNAVYRVGLAPVGASTSEDCEFEVTNQWYDRLSSGEREFYYTIKNIGSISCGTNILVSRISASSVQSTGGVEPGEIKTYSTQLTQLGPLSEVPLLGVLPSGATSANPCRFKVLRSWYQRVRQGDVARPVYLRYEVQNTGNIACSADVQMGLAEVEYQYSAKSVGAGATTGTRIGAEPDTATHLIALSPVENGCSVEVTRQFYRQYVSSSGTSGREFVWYMKNLGTTTCSAERMVSRI